MHKAKLQLRPKNENLISFIVSQLEKNEIEYSFKKGGNITKEKKIKEGYDLYINNATFAVSLSKKFKNKFKGEVKITRSLIGEDKFKSGKRIYCLTVLMRLKE